MKTLKRRSRIIGIRLSEEEFSVFTELRYLTGAHSLSEFARHAIQTALRGLTREGQAGGNLNEFRAGMKNLEERVEQLEAKFKMLKAEGAE